MLRMYSYLKRREYITNECFLAVYLPSTPLAVVGSVFVFLCLVFLRLFGFFLAVESFGHNICCYLYREIVPRSLPAPSLHQNTTLLVLGASLYALFPREHHLLCSEALCRLVRVRRLLLHDSCI